MQFYKIEGIGNDYVYVDAIKQDVRVDKDYIKKLSDRHFGIGSDGLILLKESQVADFKMEMYNSDGSLGKMCGNGLRCLAKFAYDLKYTNKSKITFETLAGIREVELLFDKHHNVVGGIAMMSKPKCLSSELVLRVNGKDYQGYYISMGNPHFVIINQEYDFDKDAHLLSNHSYFKEGANIEFIDVIDKHSIKMRVYERGSGETLACGTGACASVHACLLTHLCEGDVEVSLKGGKLYVFEEKGISYLKGASRYVFKGEYK